MATPSCGVAWNDVPVLMVKYIIKDYYAYIDDSNASIRVNEILSKNPVTNCYAGTLIGRARPWARLRRVTARLCFQVVAAAPAMD